MELVKTKIDLCLLALGHSSLQNGFKNVEVGFLPIGHTHEDIDQAFSRKAECLKNDEAKKLNGLHKKLRPSYKKAVLTRLESVANCSLLCQQEKY